MDASAEPGGRWPGGALLRLHGVLLREYETYATLLDFWGCCPSPLPPTPTIPEPRRS